MKVKSLTRVRVFVTPWAVTYEAPLCPWHFPDEDWSGLTWPSPGALPDPGTEPGSRAAGGRFPSEAPLGTSSARASGRAACPLPSWWALAGVSRFGMLGIVLL